MHLVFYDHLMYELKQYQIVLGNVYTLRETRYLCKNFYLSFFQLFLFTVLLKLFLLVFFHLQRFSQCVQISLSVQHIVGSFTALA